MTAATAPIAVRLQLTPFIFTNMSFRRQLTELARIHQLLEVEPEDIRRRMRLLDGAVSLTAPAHCQPVEPDGSLCVDTHIYRRSAAPVANAVRCGTSTLIMRRMSNKQAVPPPPRPCCHRGASPSSIAFPSSHLQTSPYPSRASNRHIELLGMRSTSRFDHDRLRHTRKMLLTVGALSASRAAAALDLNLNT